MSVSGVLRRIHLWFGILLGVQVIVWMLSGLVMSWFHIDLVRGEREAAFRQPPELRAAAYAAPGGVIAQSDGVHSVELRYFLNRPAYLVRAVSGDAIFDARTGERLSPINETQARSIANRGYVGDGEVVRLRLMETPGAEYRGGGPTPVWRADFDDRLNTRLYISPETGEILRRRNDVWRLYDFFWMLHIMDYSERTDFNNPILKAASAGGLAFALSGMLMIFLNSSRSLLVQDFRRLTSRRPANADETAKKNAPDS